MFFEILQAINAAVGSSLEPKDLKLGHVLVRALAIFLVGLVAVRSGMTRFTGRETPFDILMAIVLGAVLSRAINGSAPFWPTVAAAFLLVALHALVAHVSYHWPAFGRVV